MERPAGPDKPRVRFLSWLVLSGDHVETRFRAGMVANTVLVVSTKMTSGDTLLKLWKVTAEEFHVAQEESVGAL